MKRELIVYFLLANIFIVNLQAQEKTKVKFGKIAVADFDLSSCKVSPDAEAVIIMDAGESDFVLNAQQQFALEFKKYKRVKIINKSGFDAATVEIPLFTNGSDDEKLDNFKATTYNLENGKVTEVKLSSNDVFSERKNKNWIVKKFTFPAVNEGSIIEYSYTINSNYIFNLQPWNFQAEYPCLWSEYEIDIPEYFQYANISQGYLPFTIRKTTETQKSFNFTTDKTFRSSTANVLDGRIIEGGEKVNIPVVININKWAIKDVPALRLEKFTSAFRNYISKIEFQLSSVKYPQQMLQTFYNSWEDVTKKLLDDEDFGLSIKKPNNWLDDIIKQILDGSTSENDMARKITAYLKNNFTCLNDGVYLTNNLKNTFKNKKGNVADINLLLVDMLQYVKIIAEPVILSTKNNGYVQELYPLIDRFNYVVCEAVIDGKKYYLDATQSDLGFGILPVKCYNGYARVISDQNPRSINFSADSLHEFKKTTVFIVNDEKNNWVGSLSTDFNNYESANIRREIGTQGKNDYFKKIKMLFPYDATLQNLVAEPMTDIEKPLTISYDFDFNTKKDDLLYFNPILTDAINDNPFKSAERKYPVEMPYTINEMYTANIDVPEGYEIEELPKPEKIKFNNEEGLYEYIVQNKGSTIAIQCKLWLGWANYSLEDYEGLRDFFGKIVKKQSEQIVFKKKK